MFFRICIRLSTNPYNVVQLNTNQSAMRNPTPLLLNINGISVIDCRLLQNIVIIPGRGVLLNYWRNFIKLPLVGLALCEVTSKVQDNSRVFTFTLSGKLSAHFDVADRQLAILVTCVNGDRFLIGSNERPFPVINTTDSLPGTVTDPAGCTFSVQYSDSFGLLKVLD